MKRIFFLFSILLCSLTMTAQSAWMFNRGDSISWQPTQDMTVTFEKDPAGFFWQNIKTGNLDIIRMPIETGDGIMFADTPFLQVEKKNIEVINEGNRQFEVRLKTNISDWSSIICQPQADWVRIVDVNGRHFPVITYNFEYDANYTGESRETQINFSHQELSDVVTVFSIGETATFEVSPKEITVTNNQDPRQFTVTLSSNVSEVLYGSTYEIVGDDIEWLRCVNDGSSDIGRSFTFNYDQNYTGLDREVLVIFKNEQYNLADTVKVVSLGGKPLFEASPKEITVTNNQDPRQFTVTLSCNVSDVLIGSTYSIVGDDTEWLRCVVDEDNETQRTFTFYYDLNYTGLDREALAIFKNEQYNLADTVKVVSLGGKPLFEASPKEITVNNNQDSRQFTVTLNGNVSEVLAGSTYEIGGNGGEWLRCVSEKGDETSRIFTFECDMNYTGTDREEMVIFKNEKYNLADTVKVVSVGNNFIRAEKKNYVILNTTQLDRSLDIVISTNVIEPFDNWVDSYYDEDNLAIKVVGADNWVREDPFNQNMTFWGSQGSYHVTVPYNFNNSGEDKHIDIVIYSKRHEVSDTIRVTHYAAQLAYRSMENNAVCQPQGDIMEIPVFGIGDKQIATEVSSLPDYMHRLPDEVRDGNRYIRIEVEANDADEPRQLNDYADKFQVTVGDCTTGFYFYQPPRGAPSYAEQVEALKAFYTKTERWKNHDNWLSDKPVNLWHGVNNTNFAGDVNDTIVGKYVFYFGLYGNEIVGQMPEETATLMWAPRFQIEGNGFYGKIPDAVKKHPRWGEIGFEMIGQNPYFTGKTFDYDDFGLKISDGKVKLFADESETTVADIISRNEVTLVYNRGWGFSPGKPGDEFVNLYLDYCNKGFGLISTIICGQDDVADRDYVRKLQTEKGLPAGIVWAEEPFGNFRIAQVGSMYLLDKEGRLIQFFGGDGAIPEQWYISRIDSVCRARLGEPEQHEPYGDLYTSTDYTRDGEVTTLQTATVGRGIDIVLMGDAYVDEDIASGKYEQDMRQGMEQFFADEVYAALRERFNVYAVTVVSPNRTTSNEGKWRLNYDDSICFEYAQRIDGIDMEHVTIINIVNDDNPGMLKGHASMYEGNGVAHIETGGPTELIIHEAGGHAFAKLADEYILGGYGDNRCPEEELTSFRQWMDDCHARGMYTNVSATNDPTLVPWAHMLTDERYKNEIGIYKGAWMWPYDLWRSSENSVMNTDDYRFNAPSREAIYKRVMKLSEGDSWTYDYETFVSFDAPIREAYKQKSAVPRLQKQRQSATPKRIESRPPTIYKGTWRDAGKCEKVDYSDFNK